MNFNIKLKYNTIDVFYNEKIIFHVKRKQNWTGKLFSEIFYNDILIAKSTLFTINGFNEVKITDIISSVKAIFFNETYNFYINHQGCKYGLKLCSLREKCIYLLTKNNSVIGKLAYTHSVGWLYFLSRKPRYYTFILDDDINKDEYLYILLRLLVEFPKFNGN